MIADPLAGYDAEPVDQSVLEAFRGAFVKHVQRYQPRALWQLPDGRYIADLEKIPGYGGITMFDSSKELNCVFSDLVFWESRFREDEDAKGHMRTRDANDAYVVGALMDSTGDWHFYVVLSHVGNPPAEAKTVIQVVTEYARPSMPTPPSENQPDGGNVERKEESDE